MLKKNISRFVIWYAILTILDKVFDTPLTNWVLVYNIGMTALVCLVIDVVNAMFPSTPNKEE